MKLRVPAAAVLIVAAVLVPSAAHASGASCTITPVPLEAIQPATLTATGLPVNQPVYLETYFRYDGKNQSYGSTQVTVNPDGTWSQNFDWEFSGRLTFEFNSAADVTFASCSVTVK